MPSIDKSEKGKLAATPTPMSKLGQTQRLNYQFMSCFIV